MAETRDAKSQRLPGTRMDRPPQQPPEVSAAVNTFLGELLSDRRLFRSSTEVGELLSLMEGQTDEPKRLAQCARKDGRLFAVWDGVGYRYPVFQFNSAGLPRGNVSDLIQVLPLDSDGSGRDAALWLFAPDLALDGLTPAEMFVLEPERVVALARKRSEGGDG